VADVVDGDTVILNTGQTVRIIGIDSPETQAPNQPVECWGPEAAEFARQTLLNQPVTLIADPTQDAVDRYGRVLSYILLADGRDFSVLAAEGGHARAYMYGAVAPQRFVAITAAESRARTAGLGLWGSACAAPPPTPVPVPDPAPNRNPAVGVPDTPYVPPAPDPAPRKPATVSFKNCTEARAAGAAPIRRGEPGYASHLDRDNDGIACDT
jgi:micrococcal nuclease